MCIVMCMHPFTAITWLAVTDTIIWMVDVRYSEISLCRGCIVTYIYMNTQAEKPCHIVTMTTQLAAKNMTQ